MHSFALWRCKSPSSNAMLRILLHALFLGIVAPCGQHIVRNDLRSIVALHQAHQRASHSSGAWGVLDEGSEHNQTHSHNASGHDHGHSHDMHHDHEHNEGASTDISRDLGQRRLLQNAPAPAPIRISVNYQRLDALDSTQQQALTRVVSATVRVLQKFLMVARPPAGTMMADPYCLQSNSITGCTLYYPDFTSAHPNPDNVQCALATVNPAHIVNPATCRYRNTVQQVRSLSSGKSGPASGAGNGTSAYGSGCSSYAGTKGEAADMYMYITAVQNEDCDAGAAAWARPCLLDLGNNRPLMGGSNICPSALRLLEEEQLMAVLAHEMIHALGYTEAMFGMTRRPDGSPRPVEEVVQQVTVGGKKVSRIVTPGVAAAAAAHFGCSGLSGAQLETEGGAGSMGQHWEYTLFQGEVMVASTVFAADGSPPVLSNMTLSYLEDTGWYIARKDRAGKLVWGAGAGCELPGSTCQQYMDNNPGQQLFCDPDADSTHFGCGPDYRSLGKCRSINFTDGCGLRLAYKAQQTCIGPYASNDMPEVFGWGQGSPSGRCLPVMYRFEAGVGNSRFTYPATGRDGDTDAACFDTTCSADGTKVYVNMFDQKLECPEGEYINLAKALPTHYSAGRIGPCPSVGALCGTQNCSASACSTEGGNCVNGTCYCKLGYSGPGCSFNLITGVLVDLPDANGTPASTGASSPPPPSRAWVQVVQLTMTLVNPRSYVLARNATLAAVLDEWSDAEQVQVVLVTPSNPSGGPNSSSIVSAGEGTGGSTGAGSAASQAGQAYDATVFIPPPPPPPAPPMEVQARRSLVRAVRSLLQASSPPPPPPPETTEVTVLLTMGNAASTSVLVSRLRDANETARLTAALRAANFTLENEWLSFSTLITQVTGSPPPSGLLSSANRTAPSSDETTNKAVIIIAAAAGALAVIGIIAAVVVVAVVRARRNRADRMDAMQRPKHTRSGQYLLSGEDSRNGPPGSVPISLHAYAVPMPLPASPRRNTAPPAAAPWGSQAATAQYYASRAAALAGGQPASQQPGNPLYGASQP